MCVCVWTRVHGKQDSCLGGPPTGDMTVYSKTTAEKMISPMKTILVLVFMLFPDRMRLYVITQYWKLVYISVLYIVRAKPTGYCVRVLHNNTYANYTIFYRYRARAITLYNIVWCVNSNRGRPLRNNNYYSVVYTYRIVFTLPLLLVYTYRWVQSNRAQA
jgi:hypothetical protein